MATINYQIEAQGQNRDIQKLLHDLLPDGEMSQSAMRNLSGNRRGFGWLDHHSSPNSAISLSSQQYETSSETAKWQASSSDDNALSDMLLFSVRYPGLSFNLTRIAQKGATYCESMQNGQLLYASRYATHRLFSIPTLAHLIQGDRVPVDELHSRGIEMLKNLSADIRCLNEEEILQQLQYDGPVIDYLNVARFNDLFLASNIVVQLGGPFLEKLPASFEGTLQRMDQVVEMFLNQDPDTIHHTPYLQDPEYRSNAERFPLAIAIRHEPVQQNKQQAATVLRL